MQYRTLMLMSLVVVLLGPTFVGAYEINAKSGTITLGSIEDFERCQRDAGYSDWCLDGLTGYVRSHPEAAFEAGKSVRARFNHWVALRYFVSAIEKATPEQCADSDLSLAVVSGLSLPADDPNLTLARKVVDGRCWQALQPTIRKELHAGSELFTRNACELLKAKNQQAAECEPKPIAPAAPPAPPRSAKLAAIDVRTLQTDVSTAQLFRGDDTEQVLLVRGKAPQDDVVLLKLKGIRGPWNNQVLPAVEHLRGRDRDYVSSVEGRDWVVMTVRDGIYQIYPKGYADGLHVFRERLTDQPKRLSSADVSKEFSAAPAAPPAAR